MRENEQKAEILREMMRLMNEACGALMKVVEVQDDPMIMDFMSRSFGHLFEARYWLSEAILATNIRDSLDDEKDSGKKKN